MRWKPSTVTARQAAVVRALYELGGAESAVDTEDIAIQAHRLLDGAFTWRKYPQYINPDLVRITLVDASRMGLVTGNGRSGWRLSFEGICVATREGPELLRAARAARRRNPLAERIAQSAAVRTARRAGVEAVTFRDAERLFGLNGYVRNRRLRRSAMERGLEAVRGEPDLYAIVKSIADRFAPELEAGQG
ncbi:MAG: hypothetical protein IRZ11_01555 [Clostridia bacterium]|nr:hypothetical protein [Clostridia bacterium]